MHVEAMSYLIKHAATLKPEIVYDLGGRNVNGSPRDLFPSATTYLAVDLYPGLGVDVVADARTWTPEIPADLVVCAETLEHTDDAPGLLTAAARWLRPGGTILVTAAAPPRRPHSAIDGCELRAGEPYANVVPEDLERWLAAEFTDVEVEYHFQRSGHQGDVYARATKR
jgi:SAM-dependent methyltransferase